ncbi:MAG: hypothetical protein ABIG44_07460 [Planctomycetota bacterium]
MQRLRSLWLIATTVAILFAGTAWADPPTKNAQSAGAPSTTAPAVGVQEKPDQQQATPQQHDPEALKRLIRERLKKEWAVKPPTTQPARPPTKPGVSTGNVAPSVPPSLTKTQAPKPGQLTPQDSAKKPPPKKGCGTTGGDQVDLTPPSPDKPQPKWACDQPLVEIEPVWSGAAAVFVFKVRNNGEGVLNFSLKGG